MDVLTKSQRHKNMQRIRSKDTSIEIILRKKIWHAGYRYRKNVSTLPGKPDIVLTKYRICIFCDSEFFHGKDWDILKEKISHSPYWLNKIEKNRERDAKIDQLLTMDDWVVLHFWGNDIKKYPDDCLQEVLETIEMQKNKPEQESFEE